MTERGVEIRAIAELAASNGEALGSRKTLVDLGNTVIAKKARLADSLGELVETGGAQTVPIVKMVCDVLDSVYAEVKEKVDKRV